MSRFNKDTTKINIDSNRNDNQNNNNSKEPNIVCGNDNRKGNLEYNQNDPNIVIGNEDNDKKDIDEGNFEN